MGSGRGWKKAPGPGGWEGRLWSGPAVPSSVSSSRPCGMLPGDPVANADKPLPQLTRDLDLVIAADEQGGCAYNLICRCLHFHLASRQPQTAGKPGAAGSPKGCP